MINSVIKVVVVDDHELTRFGIVTTLCSATQIEICGEADSANKALRLIRNYSPDIVIVDINLPDTDGIELTRIIKTNWEEIKVIILTAESKEVSVLAAFAAGADSYCTKTMLKKKLLETVFATYHGETWIDSSVARAVVKNLKAPVAVQDSIIKDDSNNLLEEEKLTKRELEVLQLIARGMTNYEISKELYISVGTVKAHVHQIIAKLGCENRNQVIYKAMKAGLIEEHPQQPNASVYLKLLKAHN